MLIPLFVKNKRNTLTLLTENIFRLDSWKAKKGGEMKNILLSLMVILTVSVFANEVSTNLELMGDADGDGNEEMGFKTSSLILWWEGDDYLVDLDLTYQINTAGSNLKLSKAWKKVDLWGKGDLTIGKQQYSFGRILTSKGFSNLQIRPLDISPSEWMFKYHNQFGDLHAYIDAVWPQDDNADLGGRLKYCSSNFTLGAAYHAIDFGQIVGGDTENIMYYWEVDFEFNLMNFLKLSGQFENLDDLDDNTDDMDYYVMISYIPGFELPVLGNKVGRLLYGEFRPYAGTITRRDADGNGMGENNIFVGINFMSFDNSYMKLEYTMDTDDNVDPTIAAQFGYRF